MDGETPKARSWRARSVVVEGASEVESIEVQLLADGPPWVALTGRLAMTVSSQGRGAGGGAASAARPEGDCSPGVSG